MSEIMTRLTVVLVCLQMHCIAVAADPNTADVEIASVTFPDKHSSVTIPIEIGLNHPFVQIVINDGVPVWFLVDTGSPITAIDSSTVNIFGLPVTHRGRIGTTATVAVAVRSFKLGTLEVVKPSFPVIDLSHLSRILGKRLGGIIGMDVLAQFPFRIDYTDRRLILYKSSPPKMVEQRFVVTTKSGLIHFTATVNEVDFDLVLDTGAAEALTLYDLSPEQMKRIVSDDNTADISAATWRGSSKGKRARVNKVAIFGRAYDNLHANLMQREADEVESSFDGLAGGAVLRNYRLTIDTRQKLLWAEHVERRPWSLIVQDGDLDIDEKDFAGQTPLMKAVIEQDPADVRRLLSMKPDLEARSPLGYTALYLAASLGNLDVLQLLIDAGADINSKTYVDGTPLMVSINANLAVTNLLLQNGADLSARTKSGQSALLHASRNGTLEAMKRLVEAGADINTKDNSGDTPLISSIQLGRTEAVKYLIAKGADVNARKELGDTALMNAVHFGHASIVKQLIDAGADVNATALDGTTTALSTAIQGGNTEITKMLKTAGAIR